MNQRMLNEFNDGDYKNAIDEIKDAIQKIKNKAKSSWLKTKALDQANCILDTLKTYL